MIKEAAVNALEQCLDIAVTDNPNYCHRMGLCYYVDKSQEYYGHVMELIDYLLQDANKKLTGYPTVYLYRAISRHMKNIGKPVNDDMLRVMWEEEWRNYIKDLRIQL